MLIRSKFTRQSHHVDTALAQELVDTGLFEKVVEPKPQTQADFLSGRKPNTRWTAGYMSGHHGGELLCVTAKCSTCGASMTWEGPNIVKTAKLDTNKFWHCGQGEVIPDDLLKRYARLLPRRDEQAQENSSENPIVRMFGSTRRDNSDTAYETGDPQPI